MKTILIVLAVCLFSVSAYAGDYVVYDESGNITRKYMSVDGADIKQLPRWLQISRATYNSLTRWKKIDNDQVVEMSQDEKDVILQAEADAQAQALEDALQAYDVSNLELLTALVQRINTRIPSNVITKQEIIQQIKDNR